MIPDANMDEIRSLNRDFWISVNRVRRNARAVFDFQFRPEGEQRIFFDEINAQRNTCDDQLRLESRIISAMPMSEG